MGPTGVGKTDLAIELYKDIDINIISVDSVQIYKYLNIGSGKSSSKVLEKYPHDLIDILKPHESYSTSQFQDDVIHSIKKAFSKLSDCLSCSNYKKASCPNPGSSAAGMLCFSWSTY